MLDLEDIVTIPSCTILYIASYFRHLFIILMTLVLQSIKIIVTNGKGRRVSGSGAEDTKTSTLFPKFSKESIMKLLVFSQRSLKGHFVR